MARDTWFKCDPTDFLDGFQTCENEQQCALYAAIVFRIYQSGGPVPNDPQVLGGLCKLTRTRAARTIERLVEIGKLVLTADGRLYQRRADRELDRRATLSETRAKVGKTGGKASKVGAKLEQSESVSLPNRVGFDSVSDPGLAENSQTPKAIASPRAREGQEIDKKEENPPHPLLPQRRSKREGVPDFNGPLSEADRAAAIERINGTAERDWGEGTMDLPGWIMNEANMTAPPLDLALPGSWIRAGATVDEIKSTVTRMVAGARGNIRAFRYFDTQIRNEILAKKAADRASNDYFDRLDRQLEARRAN